MIGFCFRNYCEELSRRIKGVIKMEKMIDDLRSIININSVCEKDLSSAYPFGEGVHMALNKALEICKSYGFETKNCF